MTDIVERLRNYIPGENDDEVPLRIAEAADEIMILREALRLCKQDLLTVFRRVERELAFSERGRPPVPALSSTVGDSTENNEGGAS